MSSENIDTHTNVNQNPASDLTSNEMFMQIMTKLSTLDNRMQKIENEVGKIGEIKQTLSALMRRVDHSEREITEIKTNTRMLESNVEKLGEVFDTIVDKCDANNEAITQIKQKVNNLESMSAENKCDCANKLAELQEGITDLRCRSMKNNLIFSGIKYNPNENCEALIHDFIYRELNITYRVALGNIHRFGKPGLNGARPIVARFIYRRELEHVLQNARNLKGKPFGISEQFPAEIERKRKELYPVMKKAKQDGQSAKMVRDKLFINGKLYVPNGRDSSTNTQYRDALINDSNAMNTRLPPLPPRPYKRNRRADSSDSQDQADESSTTQS